MGPGGGAGGQDQQDHRIEAEERKRCCAILQAHSPQPPHRLGMSQIKRQQGCERQDRERSDDQGSAPPVLRDVDPVREDQDRGDEHPILHHKLRLTGSSRSEKSSMAWYWAMQRQPRPSRSSPAPRTSRATAKGAFGARAGRRRRRAPRARLRKGSPASRLVSLTMAYFQKTISPAMSR